jgi:hypothetical protein
MHPLMLLPLHFSAASVGRNNLRSWGNSSKKLQFFTASGKRFFSPTKPLILQAKTAVKPNNVKYVFLTGGSNAGAFFNEEAHEEKRAHFGL